MLMSFVRRVRLFAWSVGVALVVAAGSGQALAQPEKLGNKTAVEDSYQKYATDIGQYISGVKQAAAPNDNEANEAATAAARWFVYRLTWWEPQRFDREFLPKIVKEFDRSFMEYAVKNADKNTVFMQAFNKQMIGALKELMAKDFGDYKIAQINAGVMLPALARYGDEEFGKYLTEMLKDAKLHDALKLYALKGLRAFFVANSPKPANDVQSVRESDFPRMEVVLGFLTRAAPKDLPPDEVEALRFIRREAIKALAETRVPAASIGKTEVKIPVALGLMQVLAPEKNGLTPTTSLTERAEAAIGLCRMNAKDFESYKPEAAVYLVGKFLVDFATKYREDQPNLNPKTSQTPPLLPWKRYAERLEQGLNEMQKKAPADAPYASNLKVLMEQALPILEKMKRHESVDQPALLENALAKMWPTAPALALYQGVPNVQIQMPALKAAP